jgi:hypothetical protein
MTDRYKLNSKVISSTRVELGYKVMEGTEDFVSVLPSVVLTKEYDVMVNSEELTGTTEYLKVYARCRINRSLYNGVQLYF